MCSSKKCSSVPSPPRGEDPLAAHWHPAYDNDEDGIFLTDAQSVIVRCNRAATTLVGSPRREITGAECYRAVHQTDTYIPACPLERVRRRKRREVIRITQGGRDLEIEVTPILDADGRFLGTKHVLRDIGERANMDQEHNEAETFLNNLLHNMPDAVAVIGRDYTIRDANDRFIALYGPPEATREDIIGKRCYEVTHRASAPCDEEGHSCPLRDILQNRYRPSAYRHVHRTARGEKRTLELAVLPLIGPQGEIEGIIEIHHDVTERERLRADLARRESQLRATLYSIGDAVIATDKEGRVVMMNPVAEKLTGWSEGEALGKPLKEIFHILNEETRAPVEDPVTRVLREGIVIGLGNHTLLLTRDGREVPIADAGAPILDSEGEIAGVVLVFRDQTEERRAQRAVEEARQLAEGVVETMRDPLIVLDADLRVVSANRAFYRLFQTTPEATEGRPFYELDEGQWNIPELRRLLEEILPQNTELEGFRLEHDFARIGRRILLLNARRLQHEKEGTRLILLVIEDVTERARAEQQLRESEERYRDLVENSLQLICTHDLEGRLLSVNRAGVQIMGYNSAEELIGRNIRDFLSPDVRHLFDDYLQTIRRKGSASGLMRVRTANGEERIWEYHNTLRTEGVEQPIVRGLAYDITDRVRAEQQLRESEAQYRSLFEDVPEIIYSLSPEGHFTALNPAFERVTGWSVEEWLGKPFDELIHPQDRALARREFRRALRGETREFRPMRVLTKDGETMTLEVLGVAQVHEGRTVGVTGFAHDITDRVRAEQQLRESEERFRTYVEQANDFIFVLDPEGRLTFVNQAICEALDCREEDLLGQPATALVAPEARPLAEQALRRVWSGETVRRVVLPVRRPDGRQLLVEIRGRAFYHQGRLSHTLHIARDVTAQVRAEQALRASEKRYRNLVDSLPILIYALSKEGTFTFLNPAFETITGWPVDEWLGRPFEDLVLPEDLPLARERFARALKTTQTRTTITLRIRTAWGEPRVMEVLGVGRVEDGEITAVTGFAHDITDRVRHQREIEALAQLAQVVGETTALQPLLERILEIACQAIPAAEKGSILLREPDGSLRIRALHGYSDPRLYDFSFASHEGYSARAARERRPLIIADARGDAEIRYDGEIEEALAVQSAIVAPLIARGNLIGVIALDNASRKDAFRQHDLNLLTGIASTAALVIENARFLEETLRKEAETAALLATSLSLNYLDLDSTLHTIGRRAKELFHADGCRIFLVEPDGEHLRCLLALHQRAETVKNLRLRIGEGVTGDIARTGRAEIVNDMLHDPRAVQVPGTPVEQEAMMFTPLTDQGRIIGVMSVSRLGGEPPFTPQDLELLQGLGALAASAIASAQLYEETRRRLTEMEALHRAGQALLSARLDPEATYTAVHRAATAAMPCEAFAIVLEGEEEYRGVYLYDKGGRVPPRSIPKGQGLSGRVISTGQSVHIRDYSPESDIPAVHVGDPEPVRSILAVPIRQGERTIGMLTAQSYRPDAYDESHRIFLETLATQFAAILENTHLYEQTRARLREVETLYRSAQALSSLMTPQEIGRRLVDIMADHLEWHHVVIRRYNPSDETFDILAYHLPEETIEEQSAETLPHLRDAVPDSRSGLAGRAVREQRSLRVPDVTREAGYVPTFPGIRSGMYVPIRRGKDILGVISVESTRPNAFDEEDERLLNALAHHAAIALENARLYEKTQQQVRRLSMLHTIDSTITSSMDLRLTLNVILEQAIKGLEVDAACVLLYDPAAQTLHFAAGSGFKSDILKDVRLHLGEGYAGRVALERQPLYIAALSRDTGSLARAQRAAGERFVAYAAAPLIAKGEVKGVLEVFRRSPLEYNDEWKQFFQTLAQQAAIAIDSAQLFTSLQRSNIELTIAYDTTIESLVKALELRDKETEGHTKNVAELTVRLARAMGFEEEQLIHVRRGALLHDLGKIAVPDAILHKPGPLTEEEWEIMRRHPQYVYEFLSSIAYLRPALEIPYCHHEKWDGSGYPRGLKGEEIPLAARIFAVIDVWDALTSDRPYRKAWPKEKALEYIRQQAGKHFDPQVVEIFLEVIKGRQ